MTNALPATNLPTASSGLTPPLSKSLGSQDLAKHKALVAVELEVLAKKFDRFGWERDRGTPAHDRLLVDWMEALQHYPLDEVQAACRAAVVANPNKMPNEGHVVAEVIKIRREKAARHKASLPTPEPEPARDRVSADAAARIIAEAGFNPASFKPKGMGA